MRVRPVHLPGKPKSEKTIINIIRRLFIADRRRVEKRHGYKQYQHNPPTFKKESDFIHYTFLTHRNSTLGMSFLSNGKQWKSFQMINNFLAKPNERFLDQGIRHDRYQYRHDDYKGKQYKEIQRTARYNLE